MSQSSAESRPQQGAFDDLLPKTYKPLDHEDRIRALWDAREVFHPDPAHVDRNAKPNHQPGAKRPPYAIVIPPPNVTGALHLGHALNNTLQDILIRTHRMKGYETLWMPGADHAGIATQTVVEKRILAEGGKPRIQWKREEFIAKVQHWKDEYEATIKKQLKAMGCSCDFERWRFTMDEICAKAVREAFFQLFKDGLIYRGKRLVNWDPATQTALADDEVEMEEIDGQFYYLRYPLVKETGAEARRREGAKDKPDAQARGSDPSPLGGEGRVRGRETQPLMWGDLAHLNYPGASSHPASEQAFVTVATTRPETYLGDTAVGVNPDDPRWPALRDSGAQVLLPFVGRPIRIIADDYVVLPAADPDAHGVDPKAKFATGFLKVTPAHDQNDYELGQRHNLPMINVMAPDASISDKHGWSDVGDAKQFVGLSREAARKAVTKAFKDAGLLEGTKPYRHGVGHSYRSHVAIEPYLSDQWYVQVTDDRLRGCAQRAVKPEQRSSGTFMPRKGEPGDGSMEFFPARYAKSYEAWHDNIRDWCISRQLWWGHRIPVWHVTFSGAFSAGKGETLEQAFEDRRRACERMLLTLLTDADIAPQCQVNWSRSPGAIACFVSTASLDVAESLDIFAEFHRTRALATDKPAHLRALTQVKSRHGDSTVNSLAQLGFAGNAHQFEHDPDVLDTWFSSALWPLSTMGWPEPQAHEDTRGLLDAFNPTSVLSTAREIITLWVSRMVMFNRYFRDGVLPFEDVYVHLVVQDGDGKRMSKSAGNGVDPLDIIASHGADAMRYTLCDMATSTQDVRMPVQRDAATGRNTSPKFDDGKKFCNKLWNAARFTMTMLSEAAQESGSASRGAAPDPKLLSLIDRWMLSRLRAAAEQIESALANYEFSVYAGAVYDLFWRDFCDWYLEAIKPTLKREPAQQGVLRATLDAILRLLHPVTPFVTEAIYEKLRDLPSAAAVKGVALPPGELLCIAPWPEIAPSLRDEGVEQQFDRLRELIIAIRNVREQQKVRPQRRVTLHTDAATARQIAEGGSIVETLAGLDRVTTDKPAGAASPFAFDSREHLLSNLIDAAQAAGAADAERDRLRKQIADLEKSISLIETRLANPGYADKAPAKLVQQSRDQLESLRAERASAQASLERMP